MINIITINWNNASGLRDTLSSLRTQSLNKNKWKYRVIDGLSSDGSIKVLKENKDLIDTLIIEKDNGVYDAMNKGIACTKEGDFFLFLNSGDTFANTKVLEFLDEEVTRLGNGVDVFYGDKIDANGKLVKAYYPQSMKYGIINACHQCILYKMNNINYETNYRLFSDLDFTAQYYINGATFYYVNKAIAIYEGGGLSSIHSWKTKKEIYLIVLRRFGLCAFLRFLFVKAVRLVGIKHTSFLRRHIS
ncbi:glycosyltransferase [Pseudenterobacter timonensis]|uniref:Glycosyltransferase n=1 Tax=Pseudenterobacter timonensis TaxID=1755099 RepID=A0ABV4A3P5_9ENTR